MARASPRWLVKGRMRGVGTGGLSGKRVIRSQGPRHLKVTQRRRGMMRRKLVDWLVGYELKSALFLLCMVAPLSPTEAVVGLRGCGRPCMMMESPGSFVLRRQARNFFAAECRSQAIDSGSNTWLTKAVSSDGRRGCT
jgi:hypothetical protein